MRTRVPDKSLPEPWFSFLGDLDAAIETDVRLDCMGGFVVTFVYGFSRPTADLDVLEIAPREAGEPMLQLGMQGGPLHKKYKIYLDLVGVAHVPENYENRLTEIFPKAFSHLRLCALDPYDLTLSKLERNIQRDRDDVKYLARTVPLDLEVLKDRYQEELRGQLGNPEREDLTLKLWIEAIEEEKLRETAENPGRRRPLSPTPNPALATKTSGGASEEFHLPRPTPAQTLNRDVAASTDL